MGRPRLKEIRIRAGGEGEDELSPELSAASEVAYGTADAYHSDLAAQEPLEQAAKLPK